MSGHLAGRRVCGRAGEEIPGVWLPGERGSRRNVGECLVLVAGEIGKRLKNLVKGVYHEK